MGVNIFGLAEADDLLTGGDRIQKTRTRLSRKRKGTRHRDVFQGTNKRDFFEGLEGNDSLSGYGGNDFLEGGEGNDKIDGNDGDDVLEGGSGSDSLRGGNGRDKFVLGGNEFGFDTIEDFEDGRDKFKLPQGVEFDDLTIRKSFFFPGAITIGIDGDFPQTLTVVLDGLSPIKLTRADFVH